MTDCIAAGGRTLLHFPERLDNIDTTVSAQSSIYEVVQAA